MSETPSAQIPAAPEAPAAPEIPQPHAEEISPAVFAASLRRIKIWLTILSVIMGIAVIGACGIVATAVFGIAGLESGPPQVDQAEVESVKAEFQTALGDKLESLDARPVSMNFGDAPFPFSILSGGYGGENVIYVEYRLQDSPVVVADVLGGPFGNDPQGSGMMPTKGTLASRMTDEQFSRILAAYAAETKSPLGTIRRYNDQSERMDGPSTAPEKITIGNKEYKSGELWSAVEGKIIEGDSVDMNSGDFGEPRTAFVFHEDPETGVFAFLGTESSETMW